mgnify:CR=1 FL=1
MRKLTELTGLYSLSKTLRFELKPIGKTLENIESKGLIAQDEQRAEEYKKVKDIIDRYHKYFIKMCLHNFKIDQNDLETYVALVEDSNRDEKALDDIKKALRKQIVEAFKKGGSYSDLFKKELIQKHLPEFVTDEEEKKMVENFSKFTTYFTGFNENRKNMYSDEEKSTAIAYRLIHENLPMFIDNMKSFGRIAASDVHLHFTEIESSFSEYLNVEHLSEMFQLDYFTETLTQEQIAVYNYIVGGRTLEDGTKLQGINEYVNLYNQQHKDNRLPLLKPLYKMILSDRVALSWLPEEFASDEEMVDAINETYNTLKDVLTGDDDNSLRNLLLNINKYDVEHIYIANGLGLTDISQQLFGQYDVYTVAIKQELRNSISPTAKERRDPELYDERINKLFKSAKSFSISYLNSLVDLDHTVQSYYKQLGAYDRDGEQHVNLFTQIEMAYIAAKDILSGKHGNIGQSDAETAIIKNLLDAYKSLQHFIKPLLGSGDEADKDNEFDAKLREAWNALDIVTPLYNKVRNWLTRKPYSIEKIKLNFENAQLLGGWDKNKETDCTSVLLRKDGKYFLAIMDKKANRAFDVEDLPCDGGCFEKMNYKQIALPMGLGAFVRKCAGSAKKLGWTCPSDLLNKEGKIIIKDDEAMNVLPELIECYKNFLNIYEKDGFKYKDFNFKFKPTCEYRKLSRFFADVPMQGYKITFRNVSESFVNQLVDEGKLYLFQIWNKDFSEFSKGTPNMHTLYWKMLFDERNLANVVYKLNGQAEVFYRKRSLDVANTTIHKAHQHIMNKNQENKKLQSTFEYDIIKNRRYTVDKFQFHVPISINFKATGRDNINDNVLDIIRNSGIKHIIGIDRGERHLLYLSLIDLKGNIVKQMTLNDIVNEYNGNTYATNYRDLLAEREGNRTEARKNWKKIENIKDIKQGYLSQVVHIISKMMVEYDAIVVLEDLNMGFMRGRQKIERSVYEQFEKMLIDKLNYYVDKQKNAKEAGGLLHALQLTSKFESFKKLGKQSGCLFYIPAWNTSKIDPVTGFVNLFDTRYTNADQARRFFSQFDVIRYNADKDWFEFAFDYNNFTSKAEGTRTKWTLCTYGTRIRTFRNPAKLNQWDNEEIVLTDEFKKAFANAGIDIHGNLKEAICSLQDKKYLEPLMHLMKLLLQMRNSITNSEVDYLLSPVADENGSFYDSRTCDATLPCDADANGAYNIARKGLWAIQQIKESNAEKRPNLAIKNKEWLNFAQTKPYLND